MKKYKPSENELAELGFSNEDTTGEDHYMCELGIGEPYLGWVLPEIYGYFSDANKFLFKGVFEKFKSFEEFKARINELQLKYKK